MIELVASVEQLSPTAEFWWGVLRVLIVVGFILAVVPGVIWWERRLLSWFQDRIGPNRVGPFGLLQPIADGIKLFLKEEVTPSNVDRVIYVLAPAIALFPAFTIAATLPWGPNPLLTPIADVDIGVLWILAVSSLGVYGVVLGGWASNNKYSLLGGLRSCAQLISYELAMGVALYTVMLPTGSLRLTEVVRAQHEPWLGTIDWMQNWYILTPWGFAAGIIFLICMIAETNRAPFDLPEAESELIAGFHTEYSSMKFAVFFMGEYATMMAFSGIFAVLFLGGWSPLPLNLDGFAAQSAEAGWLWFASLLQFVNGPWMAPVWFLGKVAFFLTVYIWVRATLPRLRYDQLMSLGWKGLLPMSALVFVSVAIWMLFGWPIYGAFVGAALIGYVIYVLGVSRPRALANRPQLTLVNEPAISVTVIEVNE